MHGIATVPARYRERMKRDPAFVWETAALRRRIARPQRPTEPEPVAHEDLPQTPPQPETDGGPRWISIAEAAATIGMPVATVEAWVGGGRVPSQASEHGRLVLLGAVVDRAAEMQAVQARRGTPAVVAPAAPEVPPGSMIVPRDAWDRMIDQLGNLHEAGQQLAEARERAVKAETEAGFLKERLAELRDQLDAMKTPTPIPAAPGPAPPPAEPTPRPGVLDGLTRRLRRGR